MRRGIPGAGATLLLALVLSAGALAQERTEPRPQLSISGEANIAVEPDLAELRAGVTTEGKTAREAGDANRKAMVTAVAALRGLDIAESDLQTAGFSLQPVYDTTRAQRDRIIGFRAANTLTVKVRKLDQTGDVLDRLIAAGANTIGGVNFVVSNPSKLLDDARAEAMADARRKGEIYAKAAGLRLGRAFTIAEQAEPPFRPMMMSRAAAPEQATPIMPGEQMLRIAVQVTFDLER